MRTSLRRSFRFALTLLWALLPVSLWAQTTITVLHVNDSHSHLEAVGPKLPDLSGTIGGLEKAATVIGTLRATEPNTLLLHAGDAFHGDLMFNMYFGIPELQILRQLGVDAMAVGNHEFDLGPDLLALVLSRAPGFPMLSANLTFPSNDPAQYPLAGMIRPWLIREVGGVKVGIFGMTVPTDPTAQPGPVIIRNDVGLVAAQSVGALRAQGAQVVIMLSHLGLAYDKALAAAVPGIDFIVGGHDHAVLTEAIPVSNPTGKLTLIVQAGEFYEHVGRLKFTVDGDLVTFGQYDLIDVDDTVPPAPAVKAVVDSLKPGVTARYGDVYNLVLAQAEDDILKRYDPNRDKRDTGMGNLITDALRHKTRTAIALGVTGLISEGLAAGPLVGADLFRPVSYGYDRATGLGLKIATLQLLGSELLKGMETCLAYAGLVDTFDLQVSGLRFEYDSRKQVGHRVLLDSVKIHGHPIEPGRKYTVTVNEGIAMLLPLMGVQAENVQILPDLECNVLKDYVVGLGNVDYRSEGRVRDIAARCHRGHHPQIKAIDLPPAEAF
jgi:5'-nucleotidase/UDP-sugar diphosphatase